jgi:hypothetical protein
MQITKEFLQAEIRGLEQEVGKAQTFLTQAQAVMNAYTMLLAKIDEPELNLDEAINGGDLSQAS